jgi:hypothetical protein
LLGSGLIGSGVFHALDAFLAGMHSIKRLLNGQPWHFSLLSAQPNAEAAAFSTD